MESTLNDLREDVRNALNEQGLRAVEYAEPKIVPPIAVVVPGEPYVVKPEGRTFGGELTATLRVLIIGGKGTHKVAANEIDSMIEKAVVALDTFDVVEVSAPGEVTLNGVSHFGSIITIEATIKMKEED